MQTDAEIAAIARRLTRPIIGIENRTAQEAFDIMADRIRSRLAALASAPAGDGVDIAAEMARFEAAYPCCDLAKYKGGEVIAGRARYAEPEVDKMFSAWLSSAALARPRAAVEPVDCERCCGNGEIVTDWDRYKHAHEGDKGDEAVADCPDCDGTGKADSPRAAVGERDDDVSLAEAARDLLDAQKRLGPAVAFRLDLWACLEANLEDQS